MVGLTMLETPNQPDHTDNIRLLRDTAKVTPAMPIAVHRRYVQRATYER